MGLHVWSNKQVQIYHIINQELLMDKSQEAQLKVYN